jgi:putative ABC transport system substrate-binding protein
MRRRNFIAFLGGAATWPLTGSAQQAHAVRRIGVLTGLVEDDKESQARLAAFSLELARLGWVEGRNVLIDYRWANGDPVRAQAQAKELIALSPDVFLVGGSTAMRALGPQTDTIPIVFANANDQVATGLVASLAKPGGNVTGFAGAESLDVTGKHLEILKEAAPSVDRIVIVFGPGSSLASRSDILRRLESAAAEIGLRTIQAPVRDVAALEGVITALGPAPGDALVVMNEIFTVTHRKPIVALASRYRLPAVYPVRPFAVDGGLMSYGSNVTEMYRGAASYIDRILRGEKPADLPVQQPTKFELVINLKTARALGLTVAPSLLARADEVIE